KRALQTTVDRAPQNASFHFNLGVALERAGDLRGAAISYRDTLQHSRDHAQARARLQAMGPQAAAFLAQAPKPPPEVSVPIYGVPQQEQSRFAAPPSVGGYPPGSPASTHNPAYAAPQPGIPAPPPPPAYREPHIG